MRVHQGLMKSGLIQKRYMNCNISIGILSVNLNDGDWESQLAMFLGISA